MATITSRIDGKPLVNGSTLSGKVAWEGVPSGVTVGRVEFRVDADVHPPDGAFPVWTEHGAPYRFDGDTGFLDTALLPDGQHALGLRLFDAKGRRVATSRSYVQVKNAVPVPTPAPDPAGVLWNGDFSTGDFSQYAQVYFMRTDGTSGSVVPDPAGSGRKVGRFEVRSGDSPGGFSNERAQVQMNSGEVEGTLSRWTWGVYLPADFVDSTSFFNVITEWHHYSKTLPHDGSPPLTFQEIKGRYVCRIVNSNDPAQGNYWTEYDLGVAPRGGWADFDVQILHSSDPAKAYVDVTRDGSHLLRITGHPTRYAGDYVNYLLAGWYRGAAPQTQAVYLRNVRRLAA